MITQSGPQVECPTKRAEAAWIADETITLDLSTRVGQVQFTLEPFGNQDPHELVLSIEGVTIHTV